MVLDEGQVLDGKYVIVRPLATGSMGEVYLGRHERIGKDVAVKVLRRDCADDRAIVHRFEQEARIAAAVQSSHVVDVFDLGELPTGERFIVMEYVDGESLGTRMAREGKISARAMGTIALQILDGLVAAHAAGVVHRDLKPDNVILSKRDGHELVKLVDFGVSKRSDPNAKESGRDVKRATLDGTLLGTPMFMSPEQARGEPDGVDHRTDIFSLGVSMYEALSGEVPFNGDNVVSLLSKIMEETEVPLETRVPGIDRGLARIVRKAMAKDPDDRYQTAAEMRDALAEWCTLFASTSVMRSSFEGVARFTLPPIALDRKRSRAMIGAAAFAAIFVAWIARSPAPAPETTPTTTAATIPASTPTTDPLVVPPPPPPSPPPSLPGTAPTPSPAPPPTPSHAPTPSPSHAPARVAVVTAPKKSTTKTARPADLVRDAGAAPPPVKIEAAAPMASESEPPPPDPPAIP